MLHVNYKKKYVGTYKEIALMVLSFSMVLVFLYPRDMIKKQILSEKSNYDLSMLYLKNMLKNDSSNEVLMLALAEQSLNSGNRDLSFKLLQLLKNSKNEERRSRSYLLSYQLAKSDFFYLEKEKKKEAMQKKYQELQNLYKTIIGDSLYKENDVEGLYKEGLFLKDNASSYLLLQKLLLKNPEDVELLKDAYYLSRNMNDNKKAIKYVDKLIILDKYNPTKWNNVKYNILLEKYSMNDALALLQKESKASKEWQLKLADYYIYNKQYLNAANVYMKIFKESDNYATKKEFFKKAIKTLQGGNQMKELAKLTYEHENYFFKDASMRIEMLKIYMATGSLQKARKLSKKMLKGGNF